MTSAATTAQTILARLGELRAGKLPADRQTVPIADLEALARDYLSRSGPAGTTLGTTGSVYVTLAAAREFGAVERIHDDEAARRELTELLIDAKQSATDPDQWRTRKRSTGIDVSARVVREGRLMIVTSTSTRRTNSGGRRG